MTQIRTRSFTMVCSFAALCMAIAGCSGSGKLQSQMDGLVRSPQPPVYAARNQERLPSLLAGGDAAFSPQSAAVRRNGDNPDGTVTQPAPGAAYLKSIAGDGAEGFRVAYVIDGNESPFHFTRADKKQHPDYVGIAHYFHARTPSGTDHYFWPWTRATNGAPEYDYLDVYGWAIGPPETQFHGFAAFGLRTPAQALPLGRASYQGSMWADLWDADNPEWGSQRSLRGTVNLEANLDDRRIAGRIDNLRIGPVLGDEAAHQPLAGENWIDISGTTIGEEGRFAAEWVGNGPERQSPQDGPYHDTMRDFMGTAIGEFYGPAGEEIGGVLSGRRDATADRPEQFLIGGFGASQPEE